MGPVVPSPRIWGVELIMMIPKIVHYCWFGGRPKPIDVVKYIKSWHIMLPDYEIKEWNESNFDVDAWLYAQQAWSARKFAFVSDVARLHALYQDGGVYLDTDVEVRRPFDALMDYPVVLGFEEGEYIATSTILASPKSKLIGDFLSSYRDRRFCLDGGSLDQTTNVQVLTSILAAHGLKRDGTRQQLQYKGEFVVVLERVALSPIDYPNGIDHTSDETFAVHHFGQSWASPRTRFKASLRRLAIRAIGGERLRRVRQSLKKLFGGASVGQ